LVYEPTTPALGYDAVVLFLDELIPLAGNRAAGDVDFVSNEGSKLSKLVEARSGRSDYPHHLLRSPASATCVKLIGDHMPGALEVRFLDTFEPLGSSFDKVKLEDRNLPMIVQRRLLVPIDEAAKQQIDTGIRACDAPAAAGAGHIRWRSDGERDLFRASLPLQSRTGAGR